MSDKSKTHNIKVWSPIIRRPLTTAKNPNHDDLVQFTKYKLARDSAFVVNERHLHKPLHWQKPCKIFVGDRTDLFDIAVTNKVIDHVFAVMALSSRHTFYLTSQWMERMHLYLISRNGMGNTNICKAINLIPHNLGNRTGALSMPLRNVWIGATVEDQSSADERIPLLLRTPTANNNWINIEPLRGDIDIDRAMYGSQDHRWGMSCFGFTDGFGYEAIMKWIVVGGGADPVHPDWVRSLRDQCRAADVPFLFKQWGDWVEQEYPAEGIVHIEADGTIHDEPTASSCPVKRVGKKQAGRLLDGELCEEYPD